MLEQDIFLHKMLIQSFNTLDELKSLCDNIEDMEINFPAEFHTGVAPEKLLNDIISKVASDCESAFVALTKSASKIRKNNLNVRMLNDVIEKSSLECFSNHALHIEIAKNIDIPTDTLRSLEFKYSSSLISNHLAIEFSVIAHQNKYVTAIEATAKKRTRKNLHEIDITAIDSALYELSRSSPHPLITLGAVYGASKLAQYDELTFKFPSNYLDTWKEFTGGDIEYDDYVDKQGGIFWDAWRENLSISELSQFMSLPGLNESIATAIEKSLYNLITRRWAEERPSNIKYKIDELERFGGQSSNMRTISVTSFFDGKPPCHMIVRFTDKVVIHNPVHEHFAWKEFYRNYGAKANMASEITVKHIDSDSDTCIGVAYSVGDAATDEDGTEPSKSVKTFDEILTQKFSITDDIAKSTAFVMKIVEQSLDDMFDNIDRIVKPNDKNASLLYNWFDEPLVQQEVDDIKSNLLSASSHFAGTRKTSSLKSETNIVLKFLENFDDRLKIEQRWIYRSRIHGDLHQKNLVVQYSDSSTEVVDDAGDEQWEKILSEYDESINTIAIEFKYKNIAIDEEPGKCLLLDHWMTDFASLEVSLLHFFFTDHIYLSDVPKIIQMVEQKWRDAADLDTVTIMKESQDLKELNGYERAFYALLMRVRTSLIYTANKKNVLPVSQLQDEYTGEDDIENYRMRILLRQYYALLFYRTIRLVIVPRAPKASVIGLAAWLARHIEVDHDVSLDT